MEITNKFELHYYLENESHSIDAFVRNKCEKELLEIFQEVSKILDVQISIESFPSQEGGFRDFWNFIGKKSPQLENVGRVGVFLLAVYTAYPTKPNELDTQLKQEQIGLAQDQRQNIKADTELKQEQIGLTQDQRQNIKADTELKQLEALKQIPINSLIGIGSEKSQNNNEDKMNVLRKKMQQDHVSNETLHEFVKILDQNRKIQLSRSKIYNYLVYEKKAKKVTGVGFSVLSATGEVIEEEKFVPRSDFKKYIRNNKPDKDTNHDAFIEIVDPILKEGNYKWKGLYLDQIISFSMKDKNFKADVLDAVVTKYLATSSNI
jgi:hypothetical protein